MKAIQIEQHNPTWAEDFEREAAQLVSAISIDGMRVHHIGSTAVPQLAAKPIIDILLEVPKVELLDCWSTEFIQLGYEIMGEYGISGRRYFRKGTNRRTHHIHSFAAKSYHCKRHLAFRDYLVAHPQIAREYESVKVAAAKKSLGTLADYCDLKSDFVVFHEERALEWCN